ncbi:hypothetical protein ACWD4B_12925 [Streptomyces sp. NPDC002536]
MTGSARRVPELSCYTAGLLGLLAGLRPDAPELLAQHIRLAIRTDGPDGVIAFSHHRRIDRHGGQELAYRGAADWPLTRTGLAAELARSGRVLAVADGARLPWAPAAEPPGAPHWLVLTDRQDDRWLVEDPFSALLPHGEHRPFRGWIADDTLRPMLTPHPAAAPEVRLRDRLALGTPVAVPADGHHRWLVYEAVGSGTPDTDGPWVDDPGEVVEQLGERLSSDPEALARHLDDLWAAARHQCFRLSFPAVRESVGPEAAGRAAAAWEETPMTLRFAAQSAARGRPRVPLVRRAFGQLADVTAALAGTEAA